VRRLNRKKNTNKPSVDPRVLSRTRHVQYLPRYTFMYQ